MKTYTVAILGATGAVGQEMMKILAERDFPVGKLVPLASARSAGESPNKTTYTPPCAFGASPLINEGGEGCAFTLRSYRTGHGWPA